MGQFRSYILQISHPALMFVVERFMSLDLLLGAALMQDVPSEYGEDVN